MFGDVPYGAAGRAQYPNLIADMNGTKLAFSIFDGDLKNGSERCDDSLYTTSRDAQDAEHVAREAANMQWLRAGFEYASSVGAKGVLVAWQGDPNFNNEQKLQPASYDGYTEILTELRAQTLAFPGQVVLVHGDSHYLKIDKSFNTPSGGVLANFTRLETFGSANTHWVAADVDANDRNVFTFRPMLVPANAG